MTDIQLTTFRIDGMVNGQTVILYPTLIQIHAKKYLIDCGYEETFGAFVSQLAEINAPIEELHAVLISRDDIDHLGALQLFKDRNPDLLIYSSAIEAPSVAGDVKSERLIQAESSLPYLLEAYQMWARQFIESLKTIKRVPVDVRVKDGDLIEADIQVIHTPGHTKGHLSFYVPSQRILVASDAVVFENNQFDIANPAFTLDLNEAIRSVEKLSALPIDRLICYHGGSVETNIRQRFADLLTRYSDADKRPDQN